MTLHEFLLENGLSIDPKLQGIIGGKIAELYIELHGKKAPKTQKDYCENPVNNYTEKFLSGCSDIIIHHLTAVHNG